MMERHLEFIPSNEVNAGITCEWGDEYRDYDGEWKTAMCSEVAVVWYVYEDRFCGEDESDIYAIGFCRRHGNLVLIEERRAYATAS
jgi:hypothetical protein